MNIETNKSKSALTNERTDDKKNSKDQKKQVKAIYETNVYLKESSPYKQMNKSAS